MASIRLFRWNCCENNKNNRSNQSGIVLTPTGRVMCCVAGATLVLSQVSFSQVLNQHDTSRPQDMPTATSAGAEIKGVVKVTIDMDKGRTFMAPRAMAVNASISDSHLLDPELPVLLRGAGITTLRYPGGAFADNYHWLTNKPSNSQAPVPLRYSGYAPSTDFGHFVH